MTPNPVPPSESAADPFAGLAVAEQRLALLGLCDFEGQWDILEAATRLVVDGDAKAALIRRRLLPMADQLPALVAGEVTAHQLWVARYWFDTQMCHVETLAERPARRSRGRSKTARGARRAKERNA